MSHFQLLLNPMEAELEAEKKKVANLQAKLKTTNDAIFDEQKAKLEFKSKASAAEKKAKAAARDADAKVDEMQKLVDDANAKLEQQKAQIGELEAEVRKLKAGLGGAAATDAPAAESSSEYVGAGEIAALRAVLKEREQQIQMALSIVGSALGPEGAAKLM